MTQYLLNDLDKNFAAITLFDLVKEQSKRLIESKLATKDELDSILFPIVKISAKNNTTDSFITTMGLLNSYLSSIKLPGDFKKISSELFLILSPEIETPKNIENVEVIKSENEDIENCSKCSEDVKSSNKDELSKKEFIINELEKLAYKFGQQGSHKIAYEIEKTIKRLE